MDDRRTARDCASEDIAIKSLFLGPQSENSEWFLSKINEILLHTFDWRRRLFPDDGKAISERNKTDPGFKAMRTKLAHELQDLLTSLENETPKFTPRYIGHMVSETSLPSLLAEFAILLHNPNNASLEASRVGLRLEKEAIQSLADMIGFSQTEARGHFTSGGTLANFEAIWRALYRFDRGFASALSEIKNGRANPNDVFTLCHREGDDLETAGTLDALKDFSLLSQGPWALPADEILGFKFRGPVLLVPDNKHYSWPKAAAVFGLGRNSLWPVALDDLGRLDLEDLRFKIEKAKSEARPIVAVVSVAGTTELGEVDDVGRVQDLLDDYRKHGLHIWHHVDAAYGGFLCSLKNAPTPLTERTRAALDALSRTDSVTLDPHKLGYVPYACGAIVVRNKALYRCPKISAPYLQEGSDHPTDWRTTLEGSRSAAGAAAVWLTSRVTRFDGEGFGRILQKSVEAKEAFTNSLGSVTELRLVTPSDTNILCFAVAKSGDSLERLNERTRRLFESIEHGPDFSVSRTILTRTSYGKMIRRLCAEWKIDDDGTSDLFVVRLVLMNPFIVSGEMATSFADVFKTKIEGFLRQE